MHSSLFTTLRETVFTDPPASLPRPVPSPHGANLEFADALFCNGERQRATAARLAVKGARQAQAIQRVLVVHGVQAAHDEPHIVGVRRGVVCRLPSPAPLPSRWVGGRYCIVRIHQWR